MLLLPYALLALFGSAAVEAAANKRAVCGTSPPNKHVMDMHRHFGAQEANASASMHAMDFKAAAAAAPTAQINTYIHIIASDKTAKGGYVDKATIDKQMKVLNDNYASTGFSFILKNADYYVDPYYANLKNSNDEYALKKYLRKGSYRDLNIYYFVNTWVGNTGWCYYPTQVNPGDDNFIYDGCVLHQGTLPGGSYSPWNLGKITSHETGHWLGLIHTFEGGCNGGDSVDDTPASDSPTYGCPVGRDSCSQPGVDPIHNYMDYSDNSCVTEFTKGQISRMWSFFNYYRA